MSMVVGHTLRLGMQDCHRSSELRRPFTFEFLSVHPLKHPFLLALRHPIIAAIVFLISVPILFVGFVAFVLFVGHPLEHKWNVWRADTKNERVWEEAVARVATIEMVLVSEGQRQTLREEVTCYEGYSAKPAGLKSGPPSMDLVPKSIEGEVLQTDLPHNAVLDVSLRFLCKRVFENDELDLPIPLSNSKARIVVPGEPYCSYHDIERNRHLLSQPITISTPRVVEVREERLRALVDFDALGTSDTGLITRAFSRRWGVGIGKSTYREERACWLGKVGCSEALTLACGGEG